MMILVIALGWGGLYIRGRVSVSPQVTQARSVLYLFVGWAIWIGLQLLPLPMSWLLVIAPHSADLVLQASAITGLPVNFATISVDPHLTLQGLMLTLVFILFFAQALALLNSRSRIRIIMWVIVCSALFQAVFGSLMTLSGLEYHLFGEKEHYRGVATGSFINRNHLAGYLEMSLAVGIGLLLSQINPQADSSWRQKIRNWVLTMLEKKMLLRIMLAILVIGLVMTHSRMGNTAFFSSLVISSIIWVFLSGKRPRRNVIILFISLILIDLYIVGAWFGLEKVVDRLEETSVASETRDEVVWSLLKAIPDYGLSGSGLGTFKTVYPAYKDSFISFSYRYAHNDYLQFALEGGVAALLLAAAVLLSLFAAYRAMRSRRDPLYRGLGFSSLMAIIAIMIHSAVDFNLQIPANALMFMLMLALGWIGCYGKKTKI